MSLAGKVAIVTSSSSGIGLATTQVLLGDGCLVLGVDLHPNDVYMDLPTKEALPESGGVDILVNDAGIMDNNGGVDALKDGVLTGLVRLMGEVVKVMKEKGDGTIVNVASKAGISGAAAGVAYTASKHGLVGATTNTAWHYKEDGIRCNAIMPGGVATNIGSTLYDMDIASSMRIKPVLDVHMNAVTSEGIAAPETIAQVIVFLASDSSKGISGTILPGCRSVSKGWI
ncbi:NAD(P)-binding protein [Guyanagaster necrorhizus]|uniref:3-oxoacyl-[acyl-carrier-protein] reductase n=1 Tax=Guyanagaster necrorhizus TaxID=856835 RepID=A0A9P8AKR4_9AGAR|nr:NAD(P)-binding protein [Guyanagaster necrorhizus MCA 3950]KAG7439473.1 NAD(P)-binding protein [Guyanagaster necrorhizus MCA 3950]